ncbi:hypothetical protein HWV62_10459 [Athelia sp. TMB]|nr:hypothetical protein HWV62_10459 [Athelia sp. TMB]
MGLPIFTSQSEFRSVDICTVMDEYLHGRGKVAADQAEILALPEATAAEQRQWFEEEKARRREQTAISLVVSKVAAESEAAQSAEAKGSALNRLVVAQAQKATRGAGKPHTPRSQSVPQPNEKETVEWTRAQSVQPALDEDVNMDSSTSTQSTALVTATVPVTMLVPVAMSVPALVATTATTVSISAASTAPSPVAAMLKASQQAESVATPTPSSTTAVQRNKVQVLPKLTATQRAAAKRKDKAQAKAAQDVIKAQEMEQAGVEREAAYIVEMAKLDAEHLIANPFSIPTKAGDWVQPLIEYLASKDLGGEWCACIQAYVRLIEDIGCAQTSTTLSTDQRPAQISHWISCARKLQKPPQIDDKFLKQWMLWWSALQPTWRRSSGKLPPALYVCDPGKWGSLAMVLLSIGWYGHSIGNKPEWVATVKDVQCALEGMIEGGGKHAAPSVDGAGLEPARKQCLAAKCYVPRNMVRAIRAFLEFCYVVRKNVIDTDDLKQLREALNRFHLYRQVFIDVGVQEDFNLPRQHSLAHFFQLIRAFSTPNGICSSITESKHIKAVKKPWWRSNWYNATIQMLTTNSRLDKFAAMRANFVRRGMLDPSPVAHSQVVNIAKDDDTIPGPRTMASVQLAKTPSATNVDVETEHSSSSSSLLFFKESITTYPSAQALFYAPSDICGTGGMRRERIRAVSSWYGGAARYDTVFVETDPDSEGMLALDIVRVRLFFSFMFRSNKYPCALVHWLQHVGEAADEDTGMWVVERELDEDRRPVAAVIHLDTIFHAAHLIGVY